MRIAGWALITLGAIGLVTTVLISIIDVGVRDQYFGPDAVSPWNAVSVPHTALSLLACLIGAILVRRGRPPNALP